MSSPVNSKKQLREPIIINDLDCTVWNLKIEGLNLEGKSVGVENNR